MPRFELKNPDVREVATATFAAQRAMQTLRISIARLEPGEVDLAMDYAPEYSQQNGFVHASIITAGLDNACGIAAFTLMPAGADIFDGRVQDQSARVRERRAVRVSRAGRQAVSHAHGMRRPRLCDEPWRRKPGCNHDRHVDGDHAQSRLSSELRRIGKSAVRPCDCGRGDAPAAPNPVAVRVLYSRHGLGGKFLL